MGLNNLFVEESLGNLNSGLEMAFVESKFEKEKGITYFSPTFFCDVDYGVIYLESKKDKELVQCRLFVRFKGEFTKYSKPKMEIYDHEVNGELSPEAVLNFEEAIREYNFGGKPLNSISLLL